MAGDEGLNRRVIGVLAGDLDKVWERVEPDLKRACEYSYEGITADLLKKWIQDREAQLWLVSDGVLVTRIVVYPHLKSLQVVACGGRGMKSWLPGVISTLERYAIGHGCKRLEVIGRKGWSRVLKKTKVVALVITKEL